MQFQPYSPTRDCYGILASLTNRRVAPERYTADSITHCIRTEIDVAQRTSLGRFSCKFAGDLIKSFAIERNESIESVATEVACYIGLMGKSGGCVNAIESYDPMQSGVASYYRAAYQNGIRKLRREYTSAQAQATCSLAAFADEDGDCIIPNGEMDPAEILERAESSELITRLLNESLTSEEASYIREAYGIGSQQTTVTAIAERRGVSRRTATYVLGRALQKLRHAYRA
jgi:DNA-binding phage protein